VRCKGAEARFKRLVPCSPSPLRVTRVAAQVIEMIGGAEGIRTPDLCSAIATLSQLSYSPRRRSLRDGLLACKRINAAELACQTRRATYIRALASPARAA
jgi:hypothetical protein